MSTEHSSAPQQESVLRTILVALAVCLVCSIIVASAAVLLKDKQVKNASLDKKRNILIAAQLLKPDTNIEQAFAHIEKKWVDLDSGQFVSKNIPQNYDQRQAAKDAATSVVIAAKKDLARIGRRAKVATIYLVKNQGQIETIILPIHGRGLFSTLYGFIALKADKQTIVGLKFYEQGETPGLGGEVENPRWLALWPGKKLLDDEGRPALTLVKGGSKNDYQVDALSGASMTTRGLQKMIDYWLSEQGFGLFLKHLDVNSDSDSGSDLRSAQSAQAVKPGEA